MKQTYACNNKKIKSYEYITKQHKKETISWEIYLLKI